MFVPESCLWCGKLRRITAVGVPKKKEEVTGFHVTKSKTTNQSSTLTFLQYLDFKDWKIK